MSICLPFSLQVGPDLAVTGVWNSKNGQNRGLINNKVLQRKDMTPEESVAWNYYSTRPSNSAMSDFHLFPKLKSHFPDGQFENTLL